jgi:anti-sigma regulatory factor (Ser/Thr protein kinase)
VTAERRTFPARTAALGELSAFVEERCAQLDAGGEATLRILLVAEELFVNAVVHGYKADTARTPNLPHLPHTVRVTVRDKGREVELVVEDDAVEFDPFKDLKPLLKPSPGNLPLPGGVGRVLIAELSSRHAYQRRGASNQVTVGILKSRDSLHAKKSPKKL